MTNRYDLRSQEDQDASYATLPGTASIGRITVNMTPLKANLAPGREIPGCHPSRWVYELINNSFTTCDCFERARYADIDPHAWNHTHRLVINGNQSYTTPSQRLLSAVCLECHYHFVFKLSWDGDHAAERCDPSQAAWPPRDDACSAHHLVWVGSDSDVNVEADRSKYYPLLARENFICSAPPCTFQITLEISRPRLGTNVVELLLDHEAIKKQLEIAREREPSRYEGATDDWAYQAPLNLNTYLKNLLESAPDNVRSISKRNKRFAVLFGPRCFSIFRELEFTEEVQDSGEVDEGSFTPTAPAPATALPGTTEASTELGSYRGYIEDARAEVQCLIHRFEQSPEGPTYCLPVLYSDLRCQGTDSTDAALVNLDRYKLLGVLPDQKREVVVNAYRRQWDLMPSRRRQLVESLMGIANDANDELLSDYAMTQSSVFESQLPVQGQGDDDGIVSQALNFLGLQPPNNYTADTLIQAFRQKVVGDPAEASTARSMLLLIAQASRDDNYQTKLLMEADTRLSIDTALAVLGLERQGLGEEQVLEAYLRKSRESSGTEESQTYIDALDTVADVLDSPQLKQNCYEQRQAIGLPMQGTAKEPMQVVNFALPVGLDNIGNTCYLNSLLQYLFTVKAIRDIVLNFDGVKLDLDDESISERRLGGNKMQMDRGEAVVAQAFVRELATLFHLLQTSDRVATRPSQRLANAVLLSTHTLLNDSKPSAEAASTVPQAPPLPARPSPKPPGAEDHREMQGLDAQTKVTQIMSASNPSSETLVDREEARGGNTIHEIKPEQELNADEQLVIIDQDKSEDVDMGEASRKSSTYPTPATEPHVIDLTDSVDGLDSSDKTISDVRMVDAEEPQTVDQKVLTALEHQKRSSGTDQQDVEEVMGSIINRLQAAIRPSSVDDKTGIQLEKIMETFFVTTVNYTKKFNEKEYQNEVSFDRSITAFPAFEGPCSLYDALGRNFDQQILEESRLSRYTAIKTLPPVLHVLIQRSQSMGSKNGNPVIIPETLYLDRYMDASHDSDAFRQRVKDWTLANRIDDLKAQMAKVTAAAADADLLNDWGEQAKGSAEDSSTSDPSSMEVDGTPSSVIEDWEFDGPVDEDFILINNSQGLKDNIESLSKKPDSMQLTSDGVRQMMEDELRTHEQTLQTHLDSLESIPYRLHAVICHRGHLMSGHYWVWIHDFEDGLWRRYNDADVTENKDTAEVLQTLSTSGEPYYLCYVRDGDKDDYVNVPKRERPEPQKEEEQEAIEPAPAAVDEYIPVEDEPVPEDPPLIELA